ncbi:secretion protein EspD [Salmonella enterica subsp. salamae]|nr:secretion protein EspD [Salmonella enterica subsp. salamae]
MLNTNTELLATPVGINPTSDPNTDVPVTGKGLDLHLTRTTDIASVRSYTELPAPVQGYKMVTPSAAEDVLSKLFGGINGDPENHGNTENKANEAKAYPYLSQLDNVDPQAMMLMVTMLSMDTSTQKVAMMKDSNQLYTEGQNKALENKVVEFKKQLEEQQKAEEKAQKSKILGQVFGWLAVAFTAIAAVFNPALWAVVAVSATAMALQTAVDVMGDKAPAGLKTAAQVLGGISMAASILTAGIGGAAALMSKFSELGTKVGTTVVKVVTKAADVLINNVASKAAAVATGVTNASKSVGTTLVNNEAAQYNMLAQLSAFNVGNLTRQSEMMEQSAKAELRSAATEMQNQANYLSSASGLLSDSARINSRIVSGRI